MWSGNCNSNNTAFQSEWKVSNGNFKVSLPYLLLVLVWRSVSLAIPVLIELCKFHLRLQLWCQLWFGVSPRQAACLRYCCRCFGVDSTFYHLYRSVHSLVPEMTSSLMRTRAVADNHSTYKRNQHQSIDLTTSRLLVISDPEINRKLLKGLHFRRVNLCKIELTILLNSGHTYIFELFSFLHFH